VASASACCKAAISSAVGMRTIGAHSQQRSRCRWRDHRIGR
jgi:hypothetical protein